MKRTKIFVAYGVDYFKQYESIIGTNFDIKYRDEDKSIKEVVESEEFDCIMFLCNAETFDSTVIEEFIENTNISNEFIYVIIDASDFSENDNLDADEMIIRIGDYLTVFISDDKKDIDDFMESVFKDPN